MTSSCFILPPDAWRVFQKPTGRVSKTFQPRRDRAENRLFTDAVEFSSADTRRIGSFPGNTVLADSEGRGWRTLHASLATVNTWTGAHPTHAHHCIAYCVNQPAYLRRRLEGGTDEEMTLRPRQFFIIPGGRRSEWHRRGRTEMLMLYIRQELLDAVAGELSSQHRHDGGLDIDVPLGTSDPFLEQFALAVLNTLRSREDGSSALYMEALARAAAIHLLRTHRPGMGSKVPTAPARPGSGRALARIPAYIDAELDGDLSLETLAREADLPVNTFLRSFRNNHGTSPHQYILARRVERAKALLISTDRPIAEIALDTGFASQSHLTTAFGRLTGLPPGSYRRSQSH